MFAVTMSVLGLAAGLLSGVLGIGGGILVIPGLVYLAGFDQKMAQGTTLLMLLPPIGVLAAWEYWRRGEVSWPAALWLCVGFVLGAWAGARLAEPLSAVWLRRGFGLLMAAVGLRMLFKP